MSGRAVGGVAGAGCGVFGLASLLVGVGVTVWLGSQVMDRVDPSPSTKPAPAMAISPRGDLPDGLEVQVTASGLTSGPVTVMTCVTDRLPATTPEPPCDPSGAQQATASADGSVSTTVLVTRTVTVTGTPYDCGAFAGACSLVVQTPDAPDQGAQIPLTFVGT